MVYSNIRKYINDNTELYGGIFLKKIIGLALLSAAAGLCIAALKKKEKQEEPQKPLLCLKPTSSKKAILVVSFGTSYEETREKTIGAIEEDFRCAFPDFEIRRAFTSGMIIRKLKERDGIEADTVEQALEKLANEGFDTVICQPTHVMNGFEFDDVRAETEKWKHRFSHLICGWPLLTSSEDYSLVIEALHQEFGSLEEDTALVLMGHGTEHPANATYPALDYRLKALGYKNFFIGTVEGYPDLDTVLSEVAAVHAKKVILAPLMVVAGDHAINDMCKNEDSWKNIFENAGYQTQTVLRGLGEYPSVRKIYLQHCMDCISSLEN